MDVLASGMIVAVASVFMAAGVWSGKGYEAFQRGAKDVIIHWAEPYVDRERALSDTQEDFSAVAPWETESYAAYIQQGACSLRILPAYYRTVLI